MRQLLAAFAASGIPAAKVERFLAAEPERGRGTIRDLIAADMSNQLLDALGQPAAQTGADVKRLRERGTWRTYHRPPEGGNGFD